MKILNFGSLNIDLVYEVDHFVKKGETISASTLKTYSGGKGLNQSVALGRAHANVYHAGAVGKDGDFLIDILNNANVDTTNVKVFSTERSGNAFIQNDKNGDNCIILYGGTNQMIEKEHIDEVLSKFSNGDFLVLQNEISNVPYIIEKAKKLGMVVVLNPSPMNEKIFRLPLESIDYVILNEIEGAEIISKEKLDFNDIESELKNINKKMPNAKIVLTLGELGSIYYDGKSLLKQGIYKTKVVDTTAAGDTFTGYFIHSIMKGETPQIALDIAAKASAITVSKNGAAPSIPTYDEVLKWS